MSRHLKVGVATIGIAVGCMVTVLLLGWPAVCFLWLLMLVVLLYGWISVLEGLFLKANRRGWRPWVHVGLLLAIPVLPFLGNHLSLLELRMRLAVAFTGGQDELQGWAIELLDQPHDRLEQGEQRNVPRESWSDQVRRLKPHGVRIEPVFENGQEAVTLSYGGGFLHWWIVIGRPGSRPDPKLNDPNSDNFWIRWGDGIYDWQQG